MCKQKQTKLEKLVAWLMWVDYTHIENGKVDVVNEDEDGFTGGTCTYKEALISIIRLIPFNTKRLLNNLKWKFRKTFQKSKYPF